MQSGHDDDLNELYREADEILGPVGDDDAGPTLGAPVSEPPMWTPPEGWGTVRDYVVVRNDSGGTDVGCYFIPDDGSKPFPLVWPNVVAGSVPLKGLGEFARGVITGTGDARAMEIRVPPDRMVRAEKLIAEINAMDTIKRAMMQLRRHLFYQTCGYGPDSSWRLVKVAPGLIRK